MTAGALSICSSLLTVSMLSVHETGRGSTNQANEIRNRTDPSTVASNRLKRTLAEASLAKGLSHCRGGEREASAAQEFSGCCDGGPPHVHRHGAKRAVRLG